MLFLTVICYLLQDPIEAYSMRINRNIKQNNARKTEEDTSIDPSMYADDGDIGQPPIPADEDIGQAPYPAPIPADEDVGHAPVHDDDNDAFKRLQKKRKYTATRTDDLTG